MKTSRPDPAGVRTRLDAFAERCRRQGMNVTPQRLTIYRALLEAHDHPTPEALFERVRPGMPSLSLGTIYKTLAALAELGLVAELPATGSSSRYDANMEHHHHLVCVQCGRVSDWNDAALDLVALPRALPGFKAQRLSIHIHGLCSACERAQPPH